MRQMGAYRRMFRGLTAIALAVMLTGLTGPNSFAAITDVSDLASSTHPVEDTWYADADPSSLQLVALVLAIAAGATVLSHVNDSGFWLVSRFFGMDVKTTLRTWTVMETTLGVSIFVLALGVWAIG